MSDDPRAREEAIMLAALAHVPFDGWTAAAARHGALDLGLDAALAPIAFPGGTAEMFRCFSDWADRRAIAEAARRNFADKPMRKRVAAVVRLRLEILGPYREAVRRSVGFLANPAQAALAAGCLARLVDSLWFAAGDRSTDFGYYTKRALLAGVWTSAVFYWLADKSEGNAETWAFIDRRIADVLRLGEFRRRLEPLAERMPNPFASFRHRA